MSTPENVGAGDGDERTLRPLEGVKRPAELGVDDDDDEELDETLTERLLGLTEMFPEPVRKVCGSAFSLAISVSKSGFSLSRSALWIAASSATILVLPIIFESERAQQQEQQIQQQRQILLGPNAAVSGGGGQNLLPGMMPGAMPAMPGVPK